MERLQSERFHHWYIYAGLKIWNHQVYVLMELLGWDTKFLIT